jgi:hypothetical protein
MQKVLDALRTALLAAFLIVIILGALGVHYRPYF